MALGKKTEKEWGAKQEKIQDSRPFPQGTRATRLLSLIQQRTWEGEAQREPRGSALKGRV